MPVHAIRISRARDGLDPDQATATVELPSGRTLALLSPEDVLLEQLGAFVATGEPEAAGEAVAMLDASPLNVVRLDERASASGLSAALAELRAIAERIQQGEHLAVEELSELADRLREPVDD